MGEAILEMTPDEREVIVRREFEALISEDRQKKIDDVPLTELGIDSLDFFEKVLYLEDEYDIRIPIEELDENVTLAQIIKHL